MSELHKRWLESIRSVTVSQETSTNFLNWRLQFTTITAALLTHTDPTLDELIYGVWLDGHATPIYIGQTTEGRRRLWDLPIGESHHLANSFPPEVWSRVVAVYWGKIMTSEPTLVTDCSLERSAIGLGLEYLIQSQSLPLFNRRKKRRDGNWRDVDWNRSASVGARTAPHLTTLAEKVFRVWNELASATIPSDGFKSEHVFGRTVFPSALVRQMNGSQPIQHTPR